MYLVRNDVENGRAEPAPMQAPHDQHDRVLGRLKARQFRGIALGAGDESRADRKQRRAEA